MSPSVAEHSVPVFLVASVLVLLLLMGPIAESVGAQEEPAGAAGGTAVATDATEADEAPTEADQAAAGVTAEPAGDAPADDGWHLVAGIALGAFVIPVEADLTAEAPVPELYLDVDIAPWLGLRLGVNNAEMQLDELTLRTRSIYLAYRHTFPVRESWLGELFAGVATADSVLSGGRRELTASGGGYLLGAAGWRRMGSFDLGLRYQLLYIDSAFSGITLNTGSNQVQLTAAYRWF